VDSQKQFATFTVAGLLFGVDAGQAQEVIRSQDITPVPLAPAAIGGLINLRGNIVTAVFLNRRLNLPDIAGG
jgi:purine-binding chemotaxis protein CheW